MKPQSIVFVILVLGSVAAAQNPVSQPPTNQGRSTLSTDQRVITNHDVIAMITAGNSPERVAAMIRSSKCQGDTTPSALAGLRSIAVPESVIVAMIESTAPASQQQGAPDGNSAAFSQQPPTQQQAPNEVQNYAPYSIALLPAAPGGEVVIPFMTTDNKLAFFPLSQVQQASKENRLLGRLISYGELIALIGDLQIQVNQLKQENERLWTVVGKPSTPQTVVVQTPPAPAQTERPNNDALVKYLLLRQLFPSPQPYQLPMPTAPIPSPNRGLNCTTTYIGSTAYTNCR